MSKTEPLTFASRAEAEVAATRMYERSARRQAPEIYVGYDVVERSNAERQAIQPNHPWAVLIVLTDPNKRRWN